MGYLHGTNFRLLPVASAEFVSRLFLTADTVSTFIERALCLAAVRYGNGGGAGNELRSITAIPSPFCPVTAMPHPST
jgi:hypothetical protein